MNPQNVEPEFALSIKQPWATLVVLGLKTVEIRRWTSPIRGRIYVHAGRIPDDRPEGWARIPEEHFALTARRGGLIGTVDASEWIAYSTPRDFAKDRQLHLNDPSWFLPPRMFGLKLANPAIAPFRALPGQVKFFPVPALAPPAVEKKTPKKMVKFEWEPTKKPARRSANRNGGA